MQKNEKLLVHARSYVGRIAITALLATGIALLGTSTPASAFAAPVGDGANYLYQGGAGDLLMPSNIGGGTTFYVL